MLSRGERDLQMARGGERRGENGSINSEMLEAYAKDVARVTKLDGGSSKIISAPCFLIGLRFRTLSDFSAPFFG